MSQLRNDEEQRAIEAMARAEARVLRKLRARDPEAQVAYIQDSMFIECKDPDAVIADLLAEPLDA